MKNLKNEFLVDTQWLSNHLNDDNIVIVDCQWDENAYIKAHIPNAIMRPGHSFLKSDHNGKPGKYLPGAEEFFSMMAEAGIDSDTEVICYDEWDNHFSTRLWWVLKYYGHKKVRLLDGGWQAWVAAGLPVSFTVPEVHASRPYAARENPSINIIIDELLETYDSPDVQVLDVRRDSEYEGTELGNNKRGGHIPDAIHLEWNRLLSPSDEWRGVNFFPSKAEMQALLDQKGVSKDKTTVVHCQAGVRASFMFFCLKILGYPKVKLYDGSMGEWANVDHTPLVMEDFSLYR